MRIDKSVWLRWAALSLAGILAFVTAFPVHAAEGYSYGQFRSGNFDGERIAEEEYTSITIYSEEDLDEFAVNCQLDSWSRDKYVRLAGDIVLSDGRELMIPSFGGIFDGGGYKISNLQITASGSAMGLFRYIQEGGVVRNLSVSGKVFPGGSKSRVGMLAGVNYGRILNCSVSGQLAGTEDIGGIAGINEASGEIRVCRSGAIVVGENNTGGICGTNKGTLNNCENFGKVNTYGPQITYGLEDITMENLEDINDTENMAAHTDTGGIAGYSQGKIYYCANSGTVGYQHVGYNVGGIVGRLHQGYLQNCTNMGHILGRKDVGGIAGQMEPFLEITYLNDKLDEIEKETDKFMELLEVTHEDLSNYSREAVALTQSISQSMNRVSDAAGFLLGTTNDLWYIYNQELTGIGNDLDRLNQELGDLVEADKENADKWKPDQGEGNQGSEIPRPEKPWGGNENGNGNGAGSGNENGSGNESGILNGNQPPDWGIQIDFESYMAALRRFGEDTGNHIDNITTETNDRSGGINENLDILNREMQAAGESLTRLTDVLAEGTEKTTSNIDALAGQTKVLRNSIKELRNDLFGYEKISLEDASDEEAGGELDGVVIGAYQEEVQYDTSAFQQGKVTLCLNEGLVEADTNVGGIVGQVATEYDFDPEEDISVSGAESFNIEQTVKAVVRESRNVGDVIGKKNYAGGIVGKADFGAVISCESYGSVSAEDGSYVGGITGASGYCIRSCYFMGMLAGKDYVGGNTGKGSDIFHCYAYPELDYSGEYAGSIAGQLEAEGVFGGNYYVEGGVPGIDSIGYDGGAAPLSYVDFSHREGMPDAFSQFTVSFRADGRELASFQCCYGDAIDREKIPEIPEKEGCFGEWPEFNYEYVTSNRVLDAKYENWITTLASEEKDENGRAKVLVQGEFLPGAEMILSKREGGMAVSVVYKDEEGHVTGEYNAPLVVRVLCQDTSNAVLEVWENGEYRQVFAEVMGSYLEFSLGQSGTFRVAVPETDDKNVVIIAAAVGAGLLFALLLILCGIRKHRKKKVMKS